MRPTSIITLFVCVIGLVAGCSNGRHGFDYARQSNVQQKALPATMPTMIYVENFDLGGAQMQQDQGLIPRPHLRDLIDRPKTDDEKLQQLSDELADRIVSELKDRHLPAQRVLDSKSIATSGWRVSGAVLKVDEGNRLGRAALGFGAGASDAQLYVGVTDLSQSTDNFVSFNMDSSTGHGPGGLVTLNPYAVAIKFVMTRNASDQDIKRAAFEIAKKIEDMTKGTVQAKD